MGWRQDGALPGNDWRNQSLQGWVMLLAAQLIELRFCLLALLMQFCAPG